MESAAFTEGTLRTNQIQLDATTLIRGEKTHVVRPADAEELDMVVTTTTLVLIDDDTEVCTSVLFAAEASRVVADEFPAVSDRGIVALLDVEFDGASVLEVVDSLLPIARVQETNDLVMKIDIQCRNSMSMGGMK